MGCCQKIKKVDEPKPAIICPETPLKEINLKSDVEDEEPTTVKKHRPNKKPEKNRLGYQHDISDYEADLSDEKSSKSLEEESKEYSPKKFQEKDTALQILMKNRQNE